MFEDIEKLKKLSIEIVGMAGSEQGVRNILGTLVMQDWKPYFPDRVECVGCRQKVQFSDSVPYSGGYIVTSRCDKTGGYRLCLECHHQICCICKTSREQRTEYGYDRIVCFACMDRWDFGSDWLKREYQKIGIQEARSNRVYDFPLRVWLPRLAYFEWKCAYCLLAPYSHIDHFIPVTLGGITSPGNCVPSCRRCNMAKHQKHPDDVTKIPQEALSRVRQYLNQFS